MTDFTIHIGTRIWSSWSMRPWLALRKTGASFGEVVTPLRTAETVSTIAAFSPSGLVPVLVDNRLPAPLAVWDSLAICEYLAEAFPAAGLWPADPAARAIARSVSAEMHSGFRPMRMAMPMVLFAELPGEGLDQPGVADNIARIDAIFQNCRARFGGAGPFLFGQFTIADAMFAPVISRFRTYQPGVSRVTRDYMSAVAVDVDFRAWEIAAQKEM